MKKLYKSLLAIFAMTIILTGCKKDRPKPNKNENSVVLKTEEQIDDENLDLAYEDLVKEANEELSEDEISFIAALIKDIDSGDVDSLSNLLADPIKSEVGGDLRVLARKLSARNISGPIEKIEKISKNDDKFTIICSCEDDKLVIEADEKDKKITELKLKLGSTIVNNKKLKEDNEDFVERSYAIVNALREGKKDDFKKYAGGLNQTPEKFDQMYEGLKGDLNRMGNILEDEAKVDVVYASDYAENGPVDENLVEVRLRYKFENIDRVSYIFVFRENLDLVSLEVTSGDK